MALKLLWVSPILQNFPLNHRCSETFSDNLGLFQIMPHLGRTRDLGKLGPKGTSPKETQSPYKPKHDPSKPKEINSHDFGIEEERKS